MLSKFHLKKLVYNKLPYINTFGRRFFSATSHTNEGASATQSESLSSRFHQIYLTELDKLEKSSYILIKIEMLSFKQNIKLNLIQFQMKHTFILIILINFPSTGQL